MECPVCGCGEYVANKFKPGFCSTCYHQHTKRSRQDSPITRRKDTRSYSDEPPDKIRRKLTQDIGYQDEEPGISVRTRRRKDAYADVSDDSDFDSDDMLNAQNVHVRKPTNQEEALELAGQVGEILMEKNEELLKKHEQAQNKISYLEIAKTKYLQENENLSVKVDSLTKENRRLLLKLKDEEEKYAKEFTKFTETRRLFHQLREVQEKETRRRGSSDSNSSKNTKPDLNQKERTMLEQKNKKLKEELETCCLELTNTEMKLRLAQTSQQELQKQLDLIKRTKRSNHECEVHDEKIAELEKSIESLRGNVEKIEKENDQLSHSLETKTVATMHYRSKYDEQIRLLNASQQELGELRGRLNNTSEFSHSANTPVSPTIGENGRTESLSSLLEEIKRSPTSSTATTSVGSGSEFGDGEGDDAVLRPDANKEFFYLTCLSIKMGLAKTVGTQTELMSIKAQHLWNIACEEQIQFYEYYDWIQERVRKILARKTAKRKKSSSSSSSAKLTGAAAAGSGLANSDMQHQSQHKPKHQQKPTHKSKHQQQHDTPKSKREPKPQPTEPEPESQSELETQGESEPQPQTQPTANLELPTYEPLVRRKPSASSPIPRFLQGGSFDMDAKSAFKQRHAEFCGILLNDVNRAVHAVAHSKSNKPVTTRNRDAIHMCLCIERCLTYGIKQGVTSFFGFPNNIWDVICDGTNTAKEASLTSLLHKIQAIKEVTTPTGKGRAWIREALAEQRLAGYMDILLKSDNMIDFVKSFYEDYALIPNHGHSFIDVLDVLSPKSGSNTVQFQIPADDPRLDLEDLWDITDDGFPRKRKTSIEFMTPIDSEPLPLSATPTDASTTTDTTGTTPKKPGRRHRKAARFDRRTEYTKKKEKKKKTKKTHRMSQITALEPQKLPPHSLSKERLEREEEYQKFKQSKRKSSDSSNSSQQRKGTFFDDVFLNFESMIRTAFESDEEEALLHVEGKDHGNSKGHNHVPGIPSNTPSTKGDGYHIRGDTNSPWIPESTESTESAESPQVPSSPTISPTEDTKSEDAEQDEEAKIRTKVNAELRKLGEMEMKEKKLKLKKLKDKKMEQRLLRELSNEMKEQQKREKKEKRKQMKLQRSKLKAEKAAAEAKLREYESQLLAGTSEDHSEDDVPEVETIGDFIEESLSQSRVRTHKIPESDLPPLIPVIPTLVPNTKPLKDDVELP